MKARSAADAMNLTYNFQFWYSGDVNDCKVPVRFLEDQQLVLDGLKARWIIPEEYLADSLSPLRFTPLPARDSWGIIT